MTATLASLLTCGWPGAEVVMDTAGGAASMQRLNEAWRGMVRRAAAARTDFVLLLEDDLVFGHYFAANLESWPALHAAADGLFFGSLYNHGHSRIAGGAERHWVADPFYFWGSQALVVTPRTARFLDANWDKGAGNVDLRLARLAAAVTPILFHRPSLVQHAPGPSTWGGARHWAPDFDPFWRA